MTIRRCKPSWLFAAMYAMSLLLASMKVGAGDPASGGLVVFGDFMRINHSGDASGQVKLADLPATQGHWGLGALAGMEGEALLFDGRLLVTPGENAQGTASSPRPDDEAALFVWAQVRYWDEVAVPAAMEQAEFEAFLAKESRSRGMAADRPFLFLVQGRYPQLVWHVVNGKHGHGATSGSGHGPHANRHAAMRVFDRPASGGWLVGVYSGARFEGVVSHPGERLHLHYVNEALSVSGHVDNFSVARGAVLKLPRPSQTTGALTQ